MRDAILRAAAAEFAESGFLQAPLNRIAERAGTSIGNLYKYFASKEALFQAAIPASLAPTLQRLLRQRMAALADATDVRRLPREHAYHQHSEALLQFTLAHRDPIRFLLERSDGTAFAGFADRVVLGLSRLATQYARRAYPRAQLTAARRRTLHRIYRAFLGSLAAILRQERSPTALRQATAQLTEYHLAGLRAFFLAAQRPDKETR